MNRLLSGMLAFVCAAAAQEPETLQQLMDHGHFKRARAIIEAKYREAPNIPRSSGVCRASGKCGAIGTKR